MSRTFLLQVFCFALPVLPHADGHAIVIRHDMDESTYQVREPGPAYLVDLPHEGHAVLVSNTWLVTVAHSIFYDYTGVELSIGGSSYPIARVVIHPDYRELPAQALDGDSSQLMRSLANRSDIALIELAAPVAGVKPVAIYRQRDERGMRVKIFGRGSTGDGIAGEIAGSKAAGTLRRCENVITQASDRWLSYEFDQSETALPREGMHGSGDSGGPSLATIKGETFLVGLSSWQYYDGNLADFVGGLYGTVAYQVRISAFSEWIDRHIRGERDQKWPTNDNHTGVDQLAD